MNAIAYAEPWKETDFRKASPLSINRILHNKRCLLSIYFMCIYIYYVYNAVCDISN